MVRDSVPPKVLTLFAAVAVTIPLLIVLGTIYGTEMAVALLIVLLVAGVMVTGNRVA